MNPVVIPDFDYLTATGGCYFCRLPRRDNDRVVRSGIDIDWEGSLDICSTCITILGQKVGLITRQQAAAINVSLLEAVADAEEMRKQVARLAAKEADLEAERREVRKILAYNRGLERQDKQRAAAG